MAMKMRVMARRLGALCTTGLLLLAVFVSVALPRSLLVEAEQSDDVYYSIVWDQVYSLGSSYSLPQSCKCRETGVANSKCERFECTCVCDVTAGSCDQNCCCDPECTNAEIRRFEDAGTCEDEGPAPAADGGVTRCYSTSELEDVNPTFPLTVKSTSESAVDDLLCVEIKNTEFRGEFFKDPGTVDIGTSLDDYKEYTYEDADTTDITALGYYMAADPIVFGADTEGDGVVTAALGGGYLTVPRADSSGRCNDWSYVQFDQELDEETCLRVVSDDSGARLADTCADEFDWQDFLDATYVGIAPESVLGTSNNFVPVSVRSVAYASFYGDSSGGPNVTDAFLDASGSGACDTQYVPAGSVPNPACNISRDTLADGVGTCVNALKTLCLAFQYDSDGEIEAVFADLTLTDVPDYVGGNFSGDLVNTSLAVEQSFTVSFDATTDNSRGAAQTLGNIVNRTRAGNPGYLTGAPVLVGNEVRLAGDRAIRAPVRGLTLPSSTTCSNWTSMSDDLVVGTIDAGFGYDLKLGCQLRMDRAELEAFCADLEAAGTSARPDLFDSVTNFTVVGKLGNADPLDHSQWLDVESQDESGSVLWDTSTYTCSNVFTSLEIRFLTSRVGRKGNPQSKIVGAQQFYSRHDMQYTASSNGTTAQNFQFYVTLTFAPEDDDALDAYNPPAPPILFSVPYDVFYPFDVEDAASLSAPQLSRLMWAFSLGIASAAVALFV